MAATETLRVLADRIRALETSFRSSDSMTVALGGGLGELFPQGLATGSLVELLPCGPGAGVWTLALILAHHACGEHKELMVVDPERCFYAPAARKLGMDLDRIIFVRPRTARDAVLAAVQGLRCSGLGAVVGAFERLADRDGRRLQLAAESGGALGMLVRPPSARGAPSFAAVRLAMASLPSMGRRRRIRLEVLRCQGGRVGKKTGLEIDDATGHVRAFPLLEFAAEPASAARSTG